MIEENGILRVRCSCSSEEHAISFYQEAVDSTIYMHVHLTKRPLLSRIKYAIKYIFGYQCAFGAFEETVLDEHVKDDVTRLIKMLEKIK